MSFTFVSAIAVGAVVAVHLLIGRVRIDDETRANALLSTAGGVATGYVFLILLPKLASAAPILEAARETGVYGYLVRHAYLVALAGFVIFYGIARAGVLAEERLLSRVGSPGSRSVVPEAGFTLVFSLMSVGLAGYAALVGYLLGESSDRGLVSLALFGFAMVMHFAASDYALRRHLGATYDGFERWLFAGATVLGWGIAQVTELAPEALALLNSFFAGALIFLVVAREVPTADRSRFVGFLIGVTLFSAVALVAEVL